MSTGAKVALAIGGGLLGLCGIGMIGALASGGDEPDTASPVSAASATDEPAEPTPSATEEATAEPAAEETTEPEPEETTPAMAGVGTAVRDGKFEFVVTGVERVGTTIGESFMQEEAQGEFVIVRVDVTNIGDEARTLNSSSQTLYDAQGRQHEPSSAWFVLDDADKAFLENINPGNKVTGAPLLFDLPPGTALDRIELHDSMFSGGAEVSLAGS